MPDSETNLPKHHSDAGFRPLSKTFHSLRPPVPLPPATAPLSITQYCLSLLRSSSSSTPTIINATKSQSLTYSQFITQTRSLASSLKNCYSLSPNDVAFIVSPASVHVPVLYFALISLGVVVSPANPISSRSEIANMVELSKPVIAFAPSEHSQKLPSLKYGTILIDSPEFDSFLTHPESDSNVLDRVKVNQSDPAAILYSSGTTGRVKGVVLSHRNIIAQIAGMCLQQSSDDDDPPTDNRQVLFFTVPLFHTFGFTMFLWSVAMAHTMVLIEKSDFEGMLKAIERFKITFFPVSPPLVVAFVKSDFTDKYDLSSLQTIVCGGAPLGKDVARRFIEKFPNMGIQKGYGLTETGGVSRPIGREESKRHGSVGRIAENMEAKIVDPVSGEALPPNHRGELWLRGPTIMKGYVGDGKATSETFDSEGWLKTGDICYFDSDGFLYIVDRLKELIKYKGYQVPPAELEQLLHSHSEIADAAVIPYPDEEAGQIPMAFIVRKPESNITEARIMGYIAKQVAPYKKIRRVAFIASIPKSPAGKILRRELVNHAVSSASKL